MNKNLEYYMQLLREYVSYQSVSTDPSFKSHVALQVSWLFRLLSDGGFKVTLIKGPNTNPVIFAEYHVSSELKTTLIYGHYDVQPAAQEDGWSENPFSLQTKNGRLIARGVVDNKGQNLAHIVTALSLIKENALGCNLKFILEGNEETGNEDLSGQILQHKELFACDRLIISDGEIRGDTPTIEESLRGGGNATLKFTTAKNDAHSGLYGSGIPSAAKEMSAFLSRLLLPDGTVTLPGFYDDVDPITPEQLENNARLLELTDPVKEGLVTSLIGKYDFVTATGIRPAIEISGVSSGYTGDGYKNIIPATAVAKINFRFVASQDHDAIMKDFKEYVGKHVPDYVAYDLSVAKLYPPVKVDITSADIQHVMLLQKEIYGIEPVIVNVGGSIPVVHDFKEVLGVHPLLLSFGNNDCNMHGVDENFRIDLIEKALILSERLLRRE